MDTNMINRILSNNKIEVIVGSMKFEKEMGILTAWLEINSDSAIYRPISMDTWFGENTWNVLTDEMKDFLLENHRKNFQRMIRHASKLHVVNINGYIGKDTKEEIKVAEACKIPIKYYNSQNISNLLMFIGSVDLDLLR